MKNGLMMFTTCLLIAGELSFAQTIAPTQYDEEETPELDKTLGKRGAIERRMSEAQDRAQEVRRASREARSSRIASGTVVPY